MEHRCHLRLAYPFSSGNGVERLEDWVHIEIMGVGRRLVTVVERRSYKIAGGPRAFIVPSYKAINRYLSVHDSCVHCLLGSPHFAFFSVADEVPFRRALKRAFCRRFLLRLRPEADRAGVAPTGAPLAAIFAHGPPPTTCAAETELTLRLDF